MWGGGEVRSTNNHRESKTTAPVLDSTPHCTHRPGTGVAEVRKTSIVSLILTRASSSRIVDCLAQMYYVQFLAPYLYRRE